MSISEMIQKTHPDCRSCKEPMIKTRGVWIAKHKDNCLDQKASREALKILNKLFF